MEPMDIVGKSKEDASLPKGTCNFCGGFWCFCVIFWGYFPPWCSELDVMVRGLILFFFLYFKTII